MKRRYRNRKEVEDALLGLKSLPESFKQQALGWDDLTVSPYSYSFYSNSKKRWNNTPEGCFRLSTHWNFQPKKQRYTAKRCCPTSIPVTNGRYWTLAQYKSGMWCVIDSLLIVK